MPCLRGIELSLVIQPDSETLPEFPHPDASSVRVVSFGEAVQKVEDNDMMAPGSDSPRIQKTAPKASVYIPSTPGSQFWVNYSIQRLPEPPCYLFFKLFINGRNITNCGIKPGTASGTITRALFEPGDRWHLKQDGMLFKRSGIESRSFCFSPGPDATAAADDGGLIEVQVFRAKSRRRITPQLAPHRHQEQYGIISPSTGLLEHPEDAIYYEWVLHDAIEAPFATFCFHYRAWTYLWDLNLIPDRSDTSLRNRRLREVLKRSRCNDAEYGKLKVESEIIDIGHDMGYCNEVAADIETEPHMVRAHHHANSSVVLNEQLKKREANNSLALHYKDISTSSATPYSKNSHPHDPWTTMLLQPKIEDVFTGFYDHNTLVVSPARSYSRESLYSRLRRPLPTVNEVPRLE